MHPAFSDNRRLLWYVVVWLLAGGFLAGLLVFIELASWSRALLFALPISLFYASAAPSAYFVCRSLPYMRRRWLTAIAVFGGASLLSGLLLLGISWAWNALGPLFGAEQGIILLSQPLAVALFAAGAVFYLVSIFAHDVLIAFESVHEAAQREAESRVLARDAELQLLRTQINPHFLFNSLNSISALTSIDPAAAREMTIALAQFFRRTLALSEQEKIALADEIALCENFLSIEKTRFGKKLSSAIHAGDNARDCLLPPMTLQPLVENAIKHGIRHLDDGGLIAIDAVERDGWLHIRIENPMEDGAGNSAVGEGNGLGLRNLRERFAMLYGARGRIAWKSGGGKFTVEIALPAEHDRNERTGK